MATKAATTKPASTKRNIYQRLNAARVKMPKLQRTTEGQVGSRKYMYSTHEDVVDACIDHLIEEGINVTQTTKFVHGNGGDHVMLFVTTLTNADIPEEQITTEFPFPLDRDPQKVGINNTYSKKYGLKGIIVIPDTDDTDGADLRSKPYTPEPKKAKESTRAPRKREEEGNQEGFEPGTETVTPQKVVKAQETKQWTRYEVTCTEGTFSTFDKDTANECHTAMVEGTEIEIVFTERNGRVSGKLA